MTRWRARYPLANRTAISSYSSPKNAAGAVRLVKFELCHIIDENWDSTPCATLKSAGLTRFSYLSGTPFCLPTVPVREVGGILLLCTSLSDGR